MLLTWEVIQKKEKIDHLEKTIMELEVEKRAAEIGFIQAHGLSVDDLAEIEDESEFYSYLGEFCNLPEIDEINKKLRTAEEEKRLTENEIIEKAISLVPEDAAKNLRRMAHIVSFRKEIITTLLKHIKC